MKVLVSCRSLLALIPLGALGGVVMSCKMSSSSTTEPAASASAAPSVSAPPASAPAPGALPAGVTVSTDVPTNIAFEHYDNARFDYAVDYPTFVKLEAPSETGDGQAFNYFSRVHMWVVGQEAKKATAVDDLFRLATTRGDAGARDAGTREVTVKTRTKDGFVIEGIDGARPFLERVLTNGKAIVRFHVDYEAASKPQFGGAARHVVDSLHFGAHPRVPAGHIEPEDIPGAQHDD